ncbi:hypothetical protein WN944_005740 [Citrus x changshan-huyou]|uniref:Uncharacterized protein n=1 Tax=Citrus x changshan-huyou TaxID=2935761 RepID=A0AAP0MN12_9ROSI
MDRDLGRKFVCKSSMTNHSNSLLYDHRPFQMNNDDYERVCRIPKKKHLADFVIERTWGIIEVSQLHCRHIVSSKLNFDLRDLTIFGSLHSFNL